MCIMDYKAEKLHIQGKYEHVRQGYTPYFTDNPREACWLANKYGGMVINNHSTDPRKCYQQNGKWFVSNS